MEMINDALSVVGVLLGLVATAFGVIKVWNEASAASGKTRTDALRAAADEWRQMKDDYRERLLVVEGKVATYESEIEVLKTDVDELRRNEGRLVGWIKRLHDGIEDGSFPPLPHLPQWLVNLMIDHGYYSGRPPSREYDDVRRGESDDRHEG